MTKILSVLLLAFGLLGNANYSHANTHLGKPKSNQIEGPFLILTLKVEISPYAMPKKSQMELTPVLFSNTFKTVVIQGEKAQGNAQTISYEAGAVFMYEDKVLDDGSISADADFKGQIFIQLFNKKREAVTATIELKEGESVRYYFPNEIEEYIDFTAVYRIE